MTGGATSSARFRFGRRPGSRLGDYVERALLLHLLEGGGDDDRPALRAPGNGGRELLVGDDLEAGLDAAEADLRRRGKALSLQHDAGADRPLGGRDLPQAKRLDEVVDVDVPLSETVAERSGRSGHRAVLGVDAGTTRPARQPFEC